MSHPRATAGVAARAFVPAALLLALALLAGTAGRAAAQTSGSASVTAEVQQPIRVTKTNDLSFGTVFPGLNKTVGVTDGGAAAFAIQGQAGGNVNLTFTLPSSITSGGATLPIANWTARHSSANSPAAGTDFTPGASATAAAIGGGGFLYVFLGATAQPGAGQPAGTYTGTATLTVTYF